MHLKLVKKIVVVPKDVKVCCCYGSEYDFVSDLYWENTGGQFIRRIND